MLYEVITASKLGIRVIEGVEFVWNTLDSVNWASSVTLAVQILSQCQKNGKYKKLYIRVVFSADFIKMTSDSVRWTASVTLAVQILCQCQKNGKYKKTLY